jgi:zinc transport system permease protein
MQRSLAAGLLASVACGIVGTYVVTRRIVSMSGGIAHTAYGGVGIGYFFGFSPVLGAIGAALGAALTISWLRRRFSQYTDTLIGVLWSMGMALGVALVALSPRYAPDLMSYLFGSILYISASDLRLALALDVVVLLSVALLFPTLRALSFDEEFCEVRGLPVAWLFAALLCLVAVTVVILIRVVGIILVIALLTMPPAISRELTSGLGRIMALSVIIGAAFTVGGILLSYALSAGPGLDVPAGALIILLAGLTFVITLPVAHRVRRRIPSARTEAP